MLQNNLNSKQLNMPLETRILERCGHRVKQIWHLSQLTERYVHLIEIRKFRLTLLKIGVIILKCGQCPHFAGEVFVRAKKDGKNSKILQFV